MPKILLATPASVRATKTGAIYDTLDLWLESAMRIEGVDRYLFLNDIPQPRKSEIIFRCEDLKIAWDYENYGYIPDNRSHKARCIEDGHDYERFVVTRNRILDYALSHDYTHLFSIDSDIICRPDTLTRLMAHMRDNVAMVSVLVNTVARSIACPSLREGRGVQFPSTQWCYNIGDIIKKPESKRGYFVHIRRNKIKFDSCIRVGLTGACSILDLGPVRKHKMRYAMHTSGEDFTLCEQLRDVGYNLLCDTSRDLEGFHFQHESLIENARKYLEGGAVNYGVKTPQNP